MKIEDKIKMGQNILNNAIEMNMSEDIILKISQKLDDYTVDYYRNNKNEIDKKDIDKVKLNIWNWKCFEPY